jgi:tetratricopeptide (TPR) repeat protein
MKDTTWSVFEVAANQAKYPPVPPGILPVLKELEETIPDFAPALQKDLAALDELKRKHLQAFEDKLKRDLLLVEEIGTRNHYGVVLGNNDEYDRAKEHFQKILAKDSTFAPAWNNWGNVEFTFGHFTRAESLYTKALKHDALSRGTYLNLAILYQMIIVGASARDSIDYQRKTDEALLKAAQLLKGDAKDAYTILGLPEEPIIEGKAASLVDKIKRKIRQVKEFVDKSFRKYAQEQKIEGVVLDRHGAKGRGQIDEDRGELLAWNY